MKIYGLIGYPLTHSFSKKYFAQKFEKENITGCTYELFELTQIEAFTNLLTSQPDIVGLNVTIPYKQQVIPFLNRLDTSADKVQAVNVIKRDTETGELVGYNSDYYGFLTSLKTFIQGNTNQKALILGTGGAANAVKAALEELDIAYRMVSRKSTDESVLTYEDLSKEIIESHTLIINTTPLGMYPKTDIAPNIPYSYLTENHYCYDLVYNPETTKFMLEAQKFGAKVINGLEMLHLQAEKAWEIWNSIES